MIGVLFMSMAFNGRWRRYGSGCRVICASYQSDL